MRTTRASAWSTRVVVGMSLLLLGSGLAGCQKASSSGPVRVGDFLVSAQLVPDPPTTGDNELVLLLKDAQGRPVDGASLDFLVSMPAMGAMAEMRSGGQVSGRRGGIYHVRFPLRMQGDWTIALRISAAGHESTELRLKVSPSRKGVVFESQVEAGAPVTAADGGVGGTLDVSPARQQLIGVTWGRVERRPMPLQLRIPGRVEVDETRLADVTLRYPAFVEKLHVSQVGESVRQGEPLLTLYSPELFGAEQDFLVSTRAGNAQLLAAAEERLRLWGLSADQLRALVEGGVAQPRVTLRSPASGVVLAKNVVEGTRAETGMALYRIGNLGRVWVLGDLFQADASLVAVGQEAGMTVQGLPGAHWAGRVSFISRLHYTAARYDAEARLNQAIAGVYELQVRLNNYSAEKHHQRSAKFFYGMLAAQLAVIISTFAIAARQRNFLWSIAAAAGTAAVAFAAYVYLYG